LQVPLQLIIFLEQSTIQTLLMRHAKHIGFLFIFFLFVSTTLFAQDNAEKVKGRWIFEKVEVIKPGADAAAMHQTLMNTIWEFDGKELKLSKKESGTETLVKKGPYQVLGFSLTIGTEPGEILELTDKKFVLKTPQAILHYLRM
jgi:hypothetical protein